MGILVCENACPYDACNVMTCMLECMCASVLTRDKHSGLL
jgi:hypothetical protein